VSWVEQIQTAYRYNEWANNKILAAAAQLDDEELAGQRVGSGGSIANDLSHIVVAQQNWLALLVGEPRPAPWEPPQIDVISTLRQHYDASHERLREHMRRLSEDELTRTITTEWQGEMYTYHTWQILLHLANHGTQHRAEVGIALLALDASPGDLDLDDFNFIEED
jgi:uncharacterized damage-inducible protein DinB